MVLGTTTEVEQIAKVENDSGEQVPPASDDYRHIYGTEIDISGGYEFSTLCPARASAAVIHVEGFGDGGGSVTVHTVGPDGQRLTSRGPAENAAYGSENGEDVLVEATVAAPALEFEITGDGPVNATIYVR